MWNYTVQNWFLTPFTHIELGYNDKYNFRLLNYPLKINYEVSLLLQTIYQNTFQKFDCTLFISVESNIILKNSDKVKTTPLCNKNVTNFERL